MSLFFKRDLDWSDVPWVAGSSRASTAQGALRLVPVYSAVSLIADMFASLPQTRRKQSNGASVTLDLPPWLAKPDPRVSVFDWRYQLATSLKLRGNAYGLILGSPVNPVGLRWLNPDAVSLDETDPTGPRYWVSGYREPLTLHAQGGQLVHVREFIQTDTVEGLSPIAMFRQVYETTRLALAYGADWFEKSATPTSLLTAKGRLKPGDAAEAKRMFRAAVADGGPVTLDTDWDYKKITVSPDEAQFLATIKATATQIANIFRVPPEDIGGESGSSRTYGNREADAERFNTRTMLPLVTRYELAIGELLPPSESLSLDMEVLSRPGLLERSRADTERLQNGTLTLPEARADQGRAPLTDAEVEFWHEHFRTTSSENSSHAESFSHSESLALAVSEEVAAQLAAQMTGEA